MDNHDDGATHYYGDGCNHYHGRADHPRAHDNRDDELEHEHIDLDQPVDYLYDDDELELDDDVPVLRALDD